jgi:hypothetical protein
VAERPIALPPCVAQERVMAESFSKEARDLFDAADQAIARSRELVGQRRQIVAAYERARREQEARFNFLCQRARNRNN